jgi:hypothetical protein
MAAMTAKHASKNNITATIPFGMAAAQIFRGCV